MASPQPTGKQPVNLASPPSTTSQKPRPSRIRRDPPPVAKKELVIDPQEREQRDVVIGILAFALAIFIITVAFAGYAGWSPRQYTLEMPVD
jgi:hypothetical protein